MTDTGGVKDRTTEAWIEKMDAVADRHCQRMDRALSEYRARINSLMQEAKEKDIHPSVIISQLHAQDQKLRLTIMGKRGAPHGWHR